MNYLTKFRTEILKLKDQSNVNKKIFNKFIKRIDSNPKILKSENRYNHFCTFFVPINKKTKMIYMVDHIKAGHWIPPGGHIESGEMPVDTIRREFKEELDFQLTDEKIELFNLSIKPIFNNPRHICKIHYDFWYLVYTEIQDFKFDRGEFYDARWMSIKDAIRIIKTPQYKPVLKKIQKILK